MKPALNFTFADQKMFYRYYGAVNKMRIFKTLLNFMP